MKTAGVFVDGKGVGLGLAMFMTLHGPSSCSRKTVSTMVCGFLPFQLWLTTHTCIRLIVVIGLFYHMISYDLI